MISSGGICHENYTLQLQKNKIQKKYDAFFLLKCDQKL